MMFGLLVFELHMPGVRSLKEKRRIVRSLVERIHRRYRVSIVESGYQDKHQRAQIALAAVHSDPGSLEQLLDSVRRLVDLEGDAVVTRWDPELLKGET